MQKSALTSITTLVFVALLQTASASAANFRSYVSSTGGDSNPCTVASPCATSHGAYDKTYAGGEIVCLNSGNFSYVTIQKSITLNCEAAISGNADAPGVGGGIGTIFVDVASTDVVILRGIDLDLYGDGNQGALRFDGAGILVVDHSKITSNHNGGPGSAGILFTPSGPGKLVVTDSLVANHNAGILVKPQPGGTAQVTLERVNVSGNVFGIAADGSGSTGGINMTVKDSVLASNANDGVVATTTASGAPIGVFLGNVASTNNGFGVRSIGAKATVRVDGSKFVGNGTGVSALSGGALLTFGNNVIRANAVDGAFSGTVALQ